MLHSRPGASALHRLANDPGGQSPGDAGLHGELRARGARQTPREPAQPDIAVVPPTEDAAAHREFPTPSTGWLTSATQA
jgi:hypothetical protein